MIVLEGTRFGVVEVNDDTVIHIPRGLVGFPNDRSFVLLERGEGEPIGYLQSVDSPALSFPVVDGSVFGPEYPKPNAATLARKVGVGTDNVAVLVVVAAPRGEGN